MKCISDRIGKRDGEIHLAVRRCITVQLLSGCRNLRERGKIGKVFLRKDIVE
jgi:hypothetical protein